MFFFLAFYLILTCIRSMNIDHSFKKQEPFWAICIHKLHFIAGTMCKVTQAKQLQWNVFHLVLFGSILAKQTEQSASRIDVCITVS